MVVRAAGHGDGGFLQALESRLAQRRHAVVVLAEGAGQDLVSTSGEPERDASGNLCLKDIGGYLRQRIQSYFAERDTPVILRYIDPSYTIRSLPANSFDAQLCLALGQCAAHAGMAGRTDMLVGAWNQRLVHVPIPLAVEKRERLRPGHALWQRVLGSTGQPASMVGRSD
jgi:6-phosphofructokinase 1